MFAAAACSCTAPPSPPAFVGAWQEVVLQPGATTEIQVAPIAPDLRGELELRGVTENTTWVAVSDGREVASGRLHPTSPGLFGLQSAGPMRVAFTLPTNVPPARLGHRLRLRPGFVGEEDEAQAKTIGSCGPSGCTGVIGWPADIDTFEVSSQGGAGTELRLTGLPGIAWDLRVTEGGNLKAQAASAEGESTSVVIPGGNSRWLVTIRSRTDGASPLPYRLSLRGLGGPLAKP